MPVGIPLFAETTTTGASTPSTTSSTTQESKCANRPKPVNESSPTEAEKKTIQEWEAGCKPDSTSPLEKTIGQLASLLLSFFTPILALMATWIGDVMGNSFVMGDMYSTGAQGATNASISDLLHAVWMIFRDIMNYIFIFILVFVAFMNVVAPLGAGGESYALKTVLPKLVLAIVVINFTWFGAKVILDAGSVASRVIYGIPGEVAKSYPQAEIKPCEVKEEQYTTTDGKSGKTRVPSSGCMVVGGLVRFTKANPLKSGDEYSKSSLTNEATQLQTNLDAKTKELGSAAETAKAGIQSEIDDIQKTIAQNKSAQEKFKNFDEKNIIDYGAVVLAWGDFKAEAFKDSSVAQFFAFNIMQIQKLPMVVPGETVKWSSLFINAIAGLVIMILVLVIFFSMLVALILRVVILWVNIVMSPFLGLLMFQNEFGVQNPSGEVFGIGVFIKNAFLPATMGIPLVLGFILINAGQVYNIQAGGGGSIIDFAPGEKFINNVHNVHQLFWYIMAIMIMWSSVEIGQKSNELAGSVIGSISTTVKDIGKFIATSPMYINFIPVHSDATGKTESMDLNTLTTTMPGSLKANFIGKQNEEQTKWIPRNENDRDRNVELISADPANALRKAVEKPIEKAKEVWDTLTTSNAGITKEARINTTAEHLHISHTQIPEDKLEYLAKIAGKDAGLRDDEIKIGLEHLRSAPAKEKTAPAGGAAPAAPAPAAPAPADAKPAGGAGG